MSDEEKSFFFYQPPISKRRRAPHRRPKLTFILIGACALIYLLEFFTPIWDSFAFVPANLLTQPWTLITSIFLHAGIDHLFFNMFALFIFGVYLEPRVSTKQYLFIFFTAGILGNMAYWLTSPYGAIPAVGASGAIYGIMAMLAVLYPGLVVYVGFAPMPMIFAAVLWFVLEFTGLFVPSDIAHQAHIAGLLAGVAYGLYIRRQRSKFVYFWQK